MTQNQIAYWRLQEEKRTNQANEAIKDRTQRAQQARFEAQTALDTSKDTKDLLKMAGQFVKAATSLI